MASTILNRGGKKRVVIVDDSRTMQAALEQILSLRLGLDIVGIAGDVDTAISMIATLKPDLVTIDLVMPYIDGKVLLERLADFPAMHRVVVSAHACTNLKIMSLLSQLGADACLDKAELSRDPAQFCNKILTVLAGRKRGVVDAPLVDAPSAPAPASANVLPFPVPVDERARLDLLASLELANDDEDARLDRLTRHLARTTDFPTCLMTFMDQDRQWIKSATGFSRGFTERAHAFCNYTLCSDGSFVVPDATLDRRFSGNPFVVDDPRVRTYVGHAITSRSGVRLGAICLLDTRARKVSPKVLVNLQGMSEIVIDIIEARARPIHMVA
ncbi:MAG TPA: response regulator [Sphingomonas sp.]|jgi:CheY-like chemotaxis protein